MQINHHEAVKKYKLQTLKSLEKWITSCADDMDSDIISDIEQDSFEHSGSGVIPGTSRLYFRLHDSRGKYSCHVIKDAHAIWEYLSHTPFDEFGKMVPYFHNYCMFLYHSKTYSVACVLGIYQVVVLIVNLGINTTETTRLISLLGLNLTFLLLYVLSYGVFRGNLIKTEGLSSYVHGGVSDAMAVDRLRRGLEVSEENPAMSMDCPSVADRTGGRKRRAVSYCALFGILARGFCKYLGDICCWWYAGAKAELENKGIVDPAALKLVELQQAESHPISLSTSTAFYRVHSTQQQRYDVFQRHKRPLLGFYQQLNICYKFLSLYGGSKQMASSDLKIQAYLMAIGLYVWCMCWVAWSGAVTEFFACLATPSTQCDASITLFVLDGFGFIPLFLDLVVISSLFVSFAALMYGADVAKKLADLWVHRYAPIRRVCSRDLTGNVEDEISGEAVARYFADIIQECTSSSSKGVGSSTSGGMGASAGMLKFNVEDVVKVLPYFPKDAHECYAFRQEFMQQLTQTWNFFLFVVVVLALALLLLNIFGHKWTIAFFVSQFLTLVFDSLYYALPLMCLAYANSAANGIRGVISSSGLADFDVIGGREMWGEYIREAPAYWSVMGLPVTYEIVNGSIATLLGSLGYLLFNQALVDALGSAAGGDVLAA